MSKLIIIPTPIGNLEDISERVLNSVKEVDVLLAEDTRHTGNLLKMLGIQKRMKSYHKFNEHKLLEGFVELIEINELVGLVSDAGTPGISDPGFLIVRECIKRNIEVECLPGPTAFVPALVISGLPTEKFVFEGFLPQKKGRKTRIEKLSEEDRTMIFYESPYRIGKTLKELSSAFGPDRLASVSREISKKFEETIRGDLATLSETFSDKNNKGEFVIIVAGKN